MVSKHKSNHSRSLNFRISFLVICLVVQNVEGFSVKKVIETDDFSYTSTIDPLPVTSRDDLHFVTEQTEAQPQADEVATTEFINDEDNEISRDKRAVEETVTEKVPNEASSNEQIEFTTTPKTPFDIAFEELFANANKTESEFVKPVTPFPDAVPEQSTVNPIPSDFDINNIDGVNATGSDIIEGTRAQCQCGKSLRRIVGGEAAKIEDFPWMVGLTRGGGRPYCGGTLINSRYVVTASHCVDGQTASRITVVLMEQDFSSSSEPGARPVSVRVEHIKMHEGYNNRNIDNDIALLRLAQPLALGKYIPVCLPSSNSNDFSKEQATVTGWGAISQGGSTSSHLRKVTVPVISNSDCNTKSKYNGKITQNMMCAGLLSTGGKDSCQGDSGGPLIINNGGRKTLIGIVSWGYGCAQAQSPGVYTRVGRYPEWILANTKGADWCQG